jgi:hypothetical protein
MRNKIFVIGILGMFLLLSCLSSAVGTNEGVSEKSSEANTVERSSDDLPDLKIWLVFDRPFIGNYYNYETWVYNFGTATIPEGTYIVIRYFSTPEENIVDVFKLAHPLKPYDNPYDPSLSIHILGNFPKDLFKGDVLTVYVDPPYYDGYPVDKVSPYYPDPLYGLIKETNEYDNNVHSFTFPHAKSCNSFYPLFSLLERLPVFQKLLNFL